MPSIRVVVVGIENPAQNDASGPRHTRVSSYESYKSFRIPIRIELNLVTEKLCTAVDLRRIP